MTPAEKTRQETRELFAGKHTPGPWYIDGHEIKVNKPERAYLEDGAPETICGMLSSVSPQETKANARLIASAPDLLEVCRQLVWKLSHSHSPSGRGDDCRPGTIDRNDRVVRMARAAIAKAEGQKTT